MTAEWFDWADESQAKVGDWALTVLSVADLETAGGRSWLAAAAYFGLMYHQTEHPTREEAKAAAERAMAIPPVVLCHRCGAGADGCCLGPKPAEPCWGRVEAVDDEGEPGDPLWVHACEGHAEAYHGGAYRRAAANERTEEKP